MSPFGQKLTWTVLAMLGILGGALVHDTTAKVAFFSLAAGITSAVWIRSPGDVSMKDAVRTFNAFTDEKKGEP